MATKAIKRWTEISNWDDLPCLLQMTDVCAVMKISEPTALNMIRTGDLPGVKKGATWYVEKEALRQSMGAPPATVSGAQGIIEAVNALNSSITELLAAVRTANTANEPAA